jgi:ABC-type transport system involved in multi-copper enzyme maturation permease subunit
LLKKRRQKKLRIGKQGWIGRFYAIVKYEMLWNIRKKKFYAILIVAFALTTLTLAGGHIQSAITGNPVELDPDFVINSNIGLGGFGFFLFAIVTVMNSISGEFESGTIVPLLAKPVSRTAVFLGKLFAAFLTLLITYALLETYMTIGGLVIYGPQNNLHLLPLSLVGALFSTLIWISIVITFGTLFRSSLIAAIGALGIWLGTNIVGSIIGTLAGQGWILTYIPGSGNSGAVGGNPLVGTAISTGTDNIGPNLINYILHPSWNVTYYKIDIAGSTQGAPVWQALNTEPLANIILTSIGVAIIYFVILITLSWFVFRRAQITE